MISLIVVLYLVTVVGGVVVAIVYLASVRRPARARQPDRRNMPAPRNQGFQPRRPGVARGEPELADLPRSGYTTWWSASTHAVGA